MRERPILFSAPMVRALLNGSKTQTRRIWKMPKWAEWDVHSGGEVTGQIVSKKPNVGLIYDVDEVESPYGREGDQLWVRETWGVADAWLHDCETDPPRTIAYKADLSAKNFDPNFDVNTQDWGWSRMKWKPSIHMHRWASRLQLEVTGVGVERLNSISLNDCISEGITAKLCSEYHQSSPVSNILNPAAYHAYAGLWETINGAGSWLANPWVWVVEFKIIKPAQEWDEKRIDTIGQNGNDGLHYTK